MCVIHIEGERAFRGLSERISPDDSLVIVFVIEASDERVATAAAAAAAVH